MAKTQLKNYVFKPGIGVNDNSYPNAYGLLSANKSFIQKEATDWIQTQVNAGAAGFSGYTYNDSKCERDIGYNIDAYLKDLKYGGNENTNNVIKYYWDQDVAQVDGTRQPEIQTYGFIKTLINTYILLNSAYAATNTEVSQTIDNTKTAEATAITNINTLVDSTVSVITNGLTSMPVYVATGVGTVKIQGRYSVNELLLISNATRSEVLYNFTNIATGATVEIKETADKDFIKFTETTDGVTTIKLNYNTSTHAATDDIQIFVEQKEVRTRPYDFGTDAIERPRSAEPLSMLDADFEYGLQPTKWSAIGTLRGYPSVYEIPGTDASVSSVVTDASLSEPTQIFTGAVTNSGTEDWTWSSATHRNGNVTGNDPTIVIYEGDTLTITNNAGSGHPFYFKTVAGAGTANQVSNVTNNGSVNAANLITWVTQPGSAGTYYYGCSNHAAMGGTVTVLANNNGTGIGQSLITVTTVGAHGYTAGTPVSLKALENSIAGASRAEGTFIIVNVPSLNTFQYFAKAKVGSVSGDVLSTGYTQLRQAGFYTGASIGTPIFTVSNNGSSGTMFAQLGILLGENIIPYDGPAPQIGSPLTQANIPTGSQVTGIVDNSAGGGTYISPLTFSNTLAGQNQMVFQSGTGVLENLAIDRGDGNAIYITDITGNTATFNSNFTSLISGNRNSYTNIFPGLQASNGSLAEFDISHASDSSGLYVLDRVENDGINYGTGDTIKILGTQLGGTTPGNDAIITVTSVGSADSIASATISGTYFDNDIYLTAQTATFSGAAGTNAQFTATFLNNVYTDVTINTLAQGAGFKVGDVVVVPGNAIQAGETGITRNLYVSVDAIETTGGQAIETQLQSGGTSGYSNATNVATTGGTGTGLTLNTTITGGVITGVVINNAGSGYTQFDVVTVTGGDGTATVRLSYVKSIGAINTFTYEGLAPNLNRTFTNVTYTSTTTAGTGAVINVQVLGDAYTATFTNEGANYQPTEQFTIAGTQLGGATPANDMTIVIDNVGGTGNVTVITGSGLGVNGNTNTTVNGANRTPSGATFNISQNTDNTFNVDVANLGTGYNAGMTLSVTGTLFGGVSPANDVTITIGTVNSLVAGAIATTSSSGTGYEPVGTYIDIVGINIPSIGTGAQISILRNGGNYENLVFTTAGVDYKVGDRLQVPGGALDGVSPLNDLDISITAVGAAGNIVTANESFTEAASGVEIDLISTVTMTESTTGAITIDQPITYSAIATLQAEFTTAHGLVPGDTFITSITSDDDTNNHNLAAGSYIATEIPTTTSLRFQARTVGAITSDASANQIVGAVFPRPDSFFIHRPFDGGVQLGTGGPQHGAQAIRQSKKYIRYQSGKGIMYTTGALFAPSYDIQSVTASGIEVGAEITITTDDNDHGVQIGGVIRLLGVETPGYNSGNETAVPPKFDYEVTEVVNERTFKVLSKRRLGSTTAVLGFGAQMSVVSWHGATVRSGIFDDQNGIFWEFDGTQVNVVQRTGTHQVAGTIAIEVDKNLVTGTNTRFRDQLKAGDRIVIRGMTHVVSHVIDQTNMTVTPDFRGVTNVTGAKAMIVSDKRTKQADFNLDRLDGTGPSGYDIDIAKMQMIGIQYSWYGAGFIDYMLRGADGNFVFAHRMRNSNVNTEAFMRSGNLPVRYEVTNEGPNGRLAADMTTSQTTILLDAAEGKFFPTYGTVYIDNEIIQFTGRTDNTLTGCTRAAAFTNFQGGSVRSYTAGAAATHVTKTGVILISQTITPLISHWGSAMITDGGFDEDRGYIFSYAETGITVSTTRNTAFMIRLSPSVSNAIVGDLGERELLNRAQLLLQGLEITSEASAGGIVVQGVLNPQNYPIDPGSVSWQELSGVAQGGQPSFAQIAPGGGTQWSDGGAAATSTLTAQSNLTGTAISNDYNSRKSSGLWMRWEDIGGNGGIGPDSVGIQVGDAVSGAGIQSGTIVNSIGSPSQYNGQLESRVDISKRTTSNQAAGTVYTFTRDTTVINGSFAYLDYNQWNASGLVAGNAIGTGSTVTFPASSEISLVEDITFAGTSYYKISFNNSFTGTLTQGSGTIVFAVIDPPFARPGETVFSFIAVPGERSTLDLSQLKELTNTPLGGRGTFPNGPDVLAINVYKISGTDVAANIILKWGEAQA